MKQYIKLNNETFEVIKVKGELYPIRKVRGLGDCYNCMMFTLLINVYDSSTDKFIGQLYITKTRQEFWTI